MALGYWQHQSLPLAGEGLLLGNATTVAKISRFVLGCVCASKRGCDSQHKIPSQAADESCRCQLDVDGVLGAAGHHPCPRDAFAAEHPSLQGKAGGCAEPNPREGVLLWVFLSYSHRPLSSSSSTANRTLPGPPLNHVPKCHLYTTFKYLQGW